MTGMADEICRGFWRGNSGLDGNDEERRYDTEYRFYRINAGASNKIKHFTEQIDSEDLELLQE